MTLYKKGSFIRKAKDITISSALTITLLSSGFILPGCSSNQEDAAGTSYEEVSYSTGVKSIINEVAPGEFKIMDEVSVPIDSAVAIVNYLDGHTDKLSPDASKALIDQEISNGASFGTNNALTSMLMYGGMGFMLSRMMNNGYMNQHRANGAATAAAYNNPAAYNKSQGVMQDVNKSRTTRTVNTRPAGGKSGFFSGKTTGSAAS